MRIRQFSLSGIRCFENTGDINLSPRCNVFIGQNNAGKSTLLKAILALQPGFAFSNDTRSNSPISYYSATIEDIHPTDSITQGRPPHPKMPLRFVRLYGGSVTNLVGVHNFVIQNDNGVFSPTWPQNAIVPFLARRKAFQLNQDITLAAQQSVTGTLSNLVSRIDLVATAGHPRHEEYKEAIAKIIGLSITTKASGNGKEAGFYLDDFNFITLDKMGDGVTEMVALIVELCLARRKIFVLEEPETNLHPRGLKALLELILSASVNNQFVIATHSNIVVRELGAETETKIFKVRRDDVNPAAPSSVEELPKTAAAHREVLRELGYEFVDLGLYEGWLFLEESSAERIINDVLIPKFTPKLRGRIRTFSAGGISNIEPGINEFQRLITFVHLEPIYQDHLWIRVDGDNPGTKVVAHLREKFSYLDETRCAVFSQPNFEFYYPASFTDQAKGALTIPNKADKRRAKEQLLNDVLQWTEQNVGAIAEWEKSAKEVIDFLYLVEKELNKERS